MPLARSCGRILLRVDEHHVGCKHGPQSGPLEYARRSTRYQAGADARHAARRQSDSTGYIARRGKQVRRFGTRSSGYIEGRIGYGVRTRSRFSVALLASPACLILLAGRRWRKTLEPAPQHAHRIVVLGGARREVTACKAAPEAVSGLASASDLSSPSAITTSLRQPRSS
jgi:hypothetical protein